MDEQKILKNFGLNCKIQRQILDLSQDDIVNSTGFSKSYISKVENAKHNISMVNALKFAQIYNKTIEELTKDIGN